MSGAPRLVSCYFGLGHQDQWPRLARVLRHTAQQHCAAWDVTVAAITPGPQRSATGVESHAHNTSKLDWWTQQALGAPNGTPIVLIDADAMILRSLDAIWDQAFDVAYTGRNRSCRLPFNAGVVFVRMSDPVRRFLTAWQCENARMLGDRLHHQAWRTTHGGINQASLGATLESDAADGLRVLEVPCLEWNCEDSAWTAFDPTLTRIVHVKSMLRRAVFKLARTTAPLEPLVRIWKQLEREALQAEAAA